MNRNERDGLIFILMSVCGYALLPIFTKQIFASGMEPMDVVTWRFLIALPVYAGLLSLRQSTASFPPPRLKLLLSGPLMTMAAVTAFFGLELIPASIYVMLFYSYPAMVALISVLRGERLTAQSWVALMLTLIGIVLTVPDLRGSFAQSGALEGAGLGVLLALVNAGFVAVYFVVTSMIVRGYPDSPRASAWTIAGALWPLLLVVPLRGGLAIPPNTTAWLFLIALACFSTVLPLVALNAGIQKLGPSRAAILSTLEPVLTLMLSMLLLNETLTLEQWLGSALIVMSLILLQVRLPVGKRGGNYKQIVSETITD